MPDGVDLQLPPPCYEDMEAEAVEYDADARSLTVRIPVRSRYQNPLGLMQGGFICAAIDNTLGPLSFLVAPPSVTTDLSTQYLRPVNPNVEYIDIEGRLVETNLPDRKARHIDHAVLDFQRQRGGILIS